MVIIASLQDSQVTEVLVQVVAEQYIGRALETATFPDGEVRPRASRQT